MRYILLAQSGTAQQQGDRKGFLEDAMPELGFNLGKFLVHSAGSQMGLLLLEYESHRVRQAGEESKALASLASQA